MNKLLSFLIKTICNKSVNQLKYGRSLLLSSVLLTLLSINIAAQNCSVNAGVDFSICANSTLTLGGGKAGLFQGAGNINWSQVVGPSAVITDPTNLGTTVSSLVGGNIYKFRLSATCADGSLVYNEVTVNVLSINNASAGPDQIVCPGNGVTNLAASALGVGETGAWSIQGSANGVTVVTPSSPTSSVNVNAGNSGAVTLRWTVTNGTCTSFDDMILTNRGGVAVVNAGADRVLNSCYTTSQSTTPNGASFGGGGVALGQTGLWTVISGPNVPTISSPNSNTATFSNLIQGVYSFRWTVSGSCVNGSDIMQVTVPVSNGGITTASITSPATTTSGTTNYCDGRTDLVLVGSVPTKLNESVLWTKTGSAGGTIDAPSSSTVNVSGLTPGAAYSNTNTYTYTISSTNGCPVSTATRVITWTAPPALSISTTSPLLLGCGISSATINYTTSGGSGSVQWMILSGPVTPTYPSIPTGWSNSGGSSVTIPGFTKPGTYQLRFQKLAGSGSGCNAVFQDFTLVVATTPTASNAGTDQVLSCNVFNTNLVGNVPSIGTGMWTQISGPNTANLPSPNLNNSPISGLISGKYTFRWLISSGNTCTNTQDDVSVIVADPTPTASAAGSDISVCNSTPFILTGNSPKLNETGTWSVIPSAGVTFTDIHSPTPVVNGMQSNTTYTFTWLISNACGSSTDNVMVTTNAVVGPIPSVAGPDQCLPAGSTTITMAANSPGLGIGNWVQLTGTPASITSPSQNNTTVTGLSNGTSTFEWSITRNACTITRDTMTVTISAAATTANAGTDQSVCGTTTSLAGNTPVTGTGFWTQTAGPGGVTIANPLLPTSGVSGLIAGAYTFRWRISNNSCGSNYDDVQLNVSQPPTVATAGPDQSICSGTSVTMAGNTITNGTGIWTIVSGPNSPVITNASLYNTTITGLTNGTYDIRWRSYNGAFCPASTDDLIVDVTQAVTNASLGGNQTLCGANSATLTGNQSTTGTWTQDAGPNSSTISMVSSSAALASGLIPGLYTFRYTYTTPTTCTNTATINVTISGMPVPADAGPDMNACDVNSVVMAGNVASVGAGAWSRVSGPNTPNIVTAASPTTSIGTTTSLINGTYIYRWTITNGNCITSDDMIINRSSSSTVANAGADQPSVCGSVATMAAVNPSPGVGTWTQISGPNTAIISSTILSNTTITGMITGTYVFRWSITNGTCTASADDVSVTMYSTPTTANAGPDQSLCGNTSTTLAGNTILVGTGLWTQVSGPNTAVFSLNTDPAATVSGLITGNYVFQWTSTNGTCSTNDNVTVSITTPPSVSSAGPDQDICLFSPLTLTGNVPVTGTGSWSQISGNPATIQSPSSNTTSITGVTSGTYGFRWTIINGTCPPSTDDVLINVNDLPSLALAGPDQTLCNLSGTTLAATTPVIGTGVWTLISGPNNPSITFPNLATTTISGFIPGTYIFDWSVTNGPCVSSDQAKVTISALPTTANAGADQSICGTSSATLEGNPAVSGIGTWSRVSGPNTPTFTNVNSEVTTVTGLVSGTYVLRWTISNGSCTSSTDNVQITITTGTVTTPVAGPDQTGLALCGLTTATLAGNVPVTGIGVWSIHSGTGASFANPSDNTTTITGNAGSTYVARWTITNGTCSSFDDVTITFPRNPTTANAGADLSGVSMCGLTSVTLNANTPVIGTGAWSIVSGAGGSFDNANNPNAIFTGTSGTTYTLKWSISNSPCSVSEDEMEVKFRSIPAAPTGSLTQSFCKGDAPTLNNISVTGSNIQWYDNSVNGNLLVPSTSLINGTTYYASQTYTGCESTLRMAATVSVTSCTGPVLTNVIVSLDENSINGTLVYDENDSSTGTDKDGDNDDIQYSILSGNSLGAFAINPSTGIITVVNYLQIDYETMPVFILTIKASDGLNETTGTVTININNLNDNAPVAQPDSYSISEGGTLNVNSSAGVLNNDDDADGDPLTAILVSGTSHGTLTLNPDGSFVYHHNGGETTSDSFTYKVNDGNTDGNTVSVTITILPVNDPPVALPDAYTVNEGGTLSVSTTTGVLSNDSDPENSVISAILVTTTSHGTLSLNSDGSFNYIHDGSETATDSFTYKVNDGLSDGNTVTVTITITPGNDLPVVSNFSKTGNEDNPILFSATDFSNVFTDPEGNPLSKIKITSLPLNGTLKLSGATVNVNDEILFSDLSKITFVPDLNWNGSTSFRWNGNDGIDYALTDAVTSIIINPVNDSPVIASPVINITINENSGAHQINLAGNVTDIDGDVLSTTTLSGPSHGTVTISPSGDAIYTPDKDYIGSDSFTYRVCDNGTPSLCVDGSVIITVLPIAPSNHLPVITEILKTTPENTPFKFATEDFVSAFSDSDNDTLTIIQITSLPTSGTLKLNGVTIAAGQEITWSQLKTLEYIPSNNFTGEASFHWKASDGKDYSLENDVIITVTPVELFIPAGFSPNGDGVNDFFVITGADSYNVSVSFYNRWGNLVYENKAYKNDWDGNSNTGLLLGSKLPDGTYFYVINLNNGEKPKAGYITINR